MRSLCFSIIHTPINIIFHDTEIVMKTILVRKNKAAGNCITTSHYRADVLCIRIVCAKKRKSGEMNKALKGFIRNREKEKKQATVFVF